MDLILRNTNVGKYPVCVGTWAEARRPTVAAADVAAISHFSSEFGVETYPVEKAINPHGITNVYRQLATLKFVAHVGKGKQHAKLLSYYGSDREVFVDPARALPNVPGLSVDWTCAPDTPIQGDIARFRNRVPLVPQVYDGVLICDVYQEGPEPYQAMSEKTIMDLSKYSHDGVVYAIVRNFNGLAGADYFKYLDSDNKTQVRTEGRWVKIDGLVHFSPEEGAQCYAGHPAPEWFYKRTSAGLAINCVQQFGPYWLIKFKPEPMGAQLLGTSLFPAGLVEYRDIYAHDKSFKKETLMSWVTEKYGQLAEWSNLLPKWKTQFVPVHIEVATGLVSTFSHKPNTGILQDSCRVSVKTALERTLPMQAIRQTFPYQYENIVNGTEMYCLFRGREEYASSVTTARRMLRTVDEDLRAARSIEGPPAGMKVLDFAKLLGLVAGLGGVAYLCRRVKQQLGQLSSAGFFGSPATRAALNEIVEVVQKRHAQGLAIPVFVVSALWLCVLIPIMEEKLRSFSPWLHQCYALWEAYHNFTTFKLGALQVLCTQTLLNVTCAAGCDPGFWIRWLWHVAFNAWVCVGAVAGISDASAELMMEANAKAKVFTDQFQLSISNQKASVQQCAQAGVWHWVTLLGAIGVVFTWWTQRPKAPPPMVVSAGVIFPSIILEEKSEIISEQNLLQIETVSFVEPEQEIITSFCRAHFNQDVVTIAAIAGYADSFEVTTLALPLGFALPAVDARWIGEIARGEMKIKIDGRQHSLEQAFELLAARPHFREASSILVMSLGQLWQPARTPRNLLACLVNRIHSNPFVAPYGLPSPTGGGPATVPKGVRKTSWNNLFIMMRNNELFAFSIKLDISVQQAAAAMGGKKGRGLLAALADDIRGLNTKMTKNFKIKVDETICLKERVDQAGLPIWSINPRAICVLEPIYHSRTTVYARAYAEALHDHWNGQQAFWLGCFEADEPLAYMRFWFAAGYSSTQLGQMFTEMLNAPKCVCVAICGDDVIMVDNAGLFPYRFISSDFTKYDQSQDDGCTGVFSSLVEKEIGIPEEVRDLWFQAAADEYKVRMKVPGSGTVLDIGGDAGVQMVTGIVKTTCQNSIGGGAWAYEMVRAFIANKRSWLYDPIGNFPEEGSPDYVTLEDVLDATAKQVQYRLGLTAKINGSNTINDITFLKGWFYPYEGGKSWGWIPLPSQVLKLGKILKDPCVLVKRKINQTEQEHRRMALAYVAYGFSSTMRHVPRDYPILGAMLESYDRLGYVNNLVTFNQVLEGADYKTRVDPNLLWDHECVKFLTKSIERRYGCDHFNLRRLDHALRTIPDLPCFVADPGMLVLQSLDYS